MGTGNVRRFSIGIGDQRAKSRPGADDVLGVDRSTRKCVVGNFQNVSDVGLVAGWVFDWAVIIGVGGAEDRSLAPGDGKENSRAFGHNYRIGNGKARAIDDNVHTFGESQVDIALRKALGPRPGGVDDGAAADFGLAPGGHVFKSAMPMGITMLGRCQLKVVEGRCPMRRSRAKGIEDQASVAGKAVEVADRTGQVMCLQAGKDLKDFNGAKSSGTTEVRFSAQPI